VREEPRDQSAGRVSSRQHQEEAKNNSLPAEKPAKKKGKKAGASTNKKPNVTKKFKNQSPAKMISSGPHQDDSTTKRNST
jgi:hypothetical protein